MNKAPAFQWYPRDWLSSWRVQSMTGSEVAAYFHLLNHAWLQEPQGTLPDDPEVLAKMSRSNDRWTSVERAVLAMFEKSKKHPGRLEHSRLQIELEKQQAKRENASKAGKASAKARLEAATAAQRESNDRSTSVHSSSSSSSSPASSSSTSSKNKNPETLFGNDQPKPQQKRKHAPAIAEDNRFDEFWKIACHKRVKARARKWWAKSIKVTSPDTILAAWRKWNEHWRGLPDEKREFIVYPSKWLEDKSWEDEPPESGSDGEDPINRVGFGKVKIRVLRGEHKGWTGFACGCYGSMLKLPGGLEVKFDDVEIMEEKP